MEKLTRDIVAQIVQEKYIDHWTGLEGEVYYKDCKPYGMMAYKEVDDVLFISSTVTDEELPFTYNMIKKIKKLYNDRVICLICDSVAAQERLRESFKRYKFKYRYIDFEEPDIYEGKVMMAFGDKYDKLA